MVGQPIKKAATAKLERLISCALAVFINRPQVTVKSATYKFCHNFYSLRNKIFLVMNFKYG